VVVEEFPVLVEEDRLPVPVPMPMPPPVLAICAATPTLEVVLRATLT